MIPVNNDIRIEVCTACNYSCTICPRDIFKRKHEVMPTSLFAELISKITAEAPQYNMVTFAGFGEPLLDPDFVDKVRICRDAGLETLVLTNGSKLSEKTFMELDALGMQSVRVSFYGMTPDSYRKVHNPPESLSFEQVVKTIENICQMERSTKLLLTLNVVEGVNDDDVAEWIEYWKDRADLVEVWKPHNWVYGREFRGVEVSKRNTCGRPFNGPLQVQVDGTVNMCCFDFNGDLLLGDLKAQSLNEIFTSEEYEKIKQCHESGDYGDHDLICKNCDQRNIDKSDVMVFNSKFDIKERVEMTSSGYSKLEVE